MEERMRDVSLIRRNSYKNFVLDLYKSNYNLYENNKIGMEELIGFNLSKIDMSLISIVFPEDVDLIHVKDNEFTTSVIKTICESSGVLKFTDDIALPLDLFDEKECQKLYPIKSIDRIHTYGEAHGTESKETYDIKIIRENDYTQDVDFLMAGYLPVGTRYDVSMIFITENQPFIRLIKYLNGYKNKNFNYMERCYIALITDSDPSEELLAKLNKIMDFMDDEKINVNKFIKEEFGIRKKRTIPELGLEENQEVENLNIEPRETIILPETENIKVKGKINIVNEFGHVAAGTITEFIVGEELQKPLVIEDNNLCIPDILNNEDTYKNPESYGFLINRLLKEFYSVEESEKTTITREKLLGLIKTLHDLADRHKDYKPIEEKEIIINQSISSEKNIVENGITTHLVPKGEDKMIDITDKKDFIDISMFTTKALTYEDKLKKLLDYTNIIISYDLERRILESFNSIKPLIISKSNKDVYYLLMFLSMVNNSVISSISNETPNDIVKNFMNIFSGYRDILREKIKISENEIRYFMKPIGQCISNDIECESPSNCEGYYTHAFINITTMSKKEIKTVMNSIINTDKYIYFVILTDDISKIKIDKVILDSYFDEPKTRLNKLLSLFKK